MENKKITEGEEIVTLCSALSNEKRVRLLQYIHEVGQVTLREVHENFSNEIGLSHRETTHKYLEKLVDSDILKKERDAEVNEFVYFTDFDCVEIIL
ncbi:BlaI/MecI/CopY family transcriptional regulator [Haladaptatus sp. F3-133]|jgi:predicted HTH transcriptional regulator|uniref:BlaI/MecI/CopY family transcriptional regulator n=1 Tax=Halorutilus salinus TaxID=2487751 RepID=A0A9Q4C5B9_9EURY|nr:BlaI/MecI/CopY family transcriptional regulator [Halorutilus salinus]MCX2819738.1 BlaI/MecI/CopY family transcriptional regulator [Halorutilus salinus]